MTVDPVPTVGCPTGLPTPTNEESHANAAPSSVPDRPKHRRLGGGTPGRGGHGLWLGRRIHGSTPRGGAASTPRGPRSPCAWVPDQSDPCAALVGLQQGIFAKNLPPNVTLQTSTYNAGPAEVTALLAGSLDAAYMGPNSAITAYSQGNKAIRIISGATSGGAALVVAPGITSRDQLKGKTVASPAAGEHPGRRPADVAVQAGAHLPRVRTAAAVRCRSSPRTTPPPWPRSRPAPSPVPGYRSHGRPAWWTRATATCWSTRRPLWPKGHFSTTVLVVSTDFLSAHPSTGDRSPEGSAGHDVLPDAEPATAARPTRTPNWPPTTGKPLKPRSCRPPGPT